MAKSTTTGSYQVIVAEAARRAAVLYKTNYDQCVRECKEDGVSAGSLADFVKRELDDANWDDVKTAMEEILTEHDWFGRRNELKHESALVIIRSSDNIDLAIDNGGSYTEVARACLLGDICVQILKGFKCKISRDLHGYFDGI